MATMPRTEAEQTAPSHNIDAYPTPITSTPKQFHTLQLSGYNYALDKMHEILSQFPPPKRSEAHLRVANAPKLIEYLAWKVASTKALVQRLDCIEANRIFGKERGHLLQKQAQEDENARVSVAHTLASLSFGSLGPAFPSAQASSVQPPSSQASSTLMLPGPYSALTTPPTAISQDTMSSFNRIQRPLSPTFPNPREIPMPEGDDAQYMDPRQEDVLARWVKGGDKQDITLEIPGRDSNDEPALRKITRYLDNGVAFREAKDVPMSVAAGKRPVGSRSKTSKAKSAPTSRTFGTSAPGDPQSKKRRAPESDGKYGVPPPSLSKRRRSSKDDNSAPPSKRANKTQRKTSGGSQRRTSGGSDANRKVSSSSSASAGSQLSNQDFDRLRAVLPDLNMAQVEEAFKSSGQSVMPAPPIPNPRRAIPSTERVDPAPTSGFMGEGRRRGARPPPITTLRTRSSRAHITPSPSPITPQATPSSAGTSRAKNKYVPTTPNPLRWTAVELYHLNGLARQGLLPKDLHPLMVEQFPDRERSVHAIKDRRDKMARNKELVGMVPDYASKYAHVDGNSRGRDSQSVVSQAPSAN